MPTIKVIEGTGPNAIEMELTFKDSATKDDIYRIIADIVRSASKLHVALGGSGLELVEAHCDKILGEVD